jgi:peptidoglycan L-alanyl-D-glutamate endopeptidase CwlK
MDKYFFSQKSKSLLSSCHPDLQKIFNEVIKDRDCKILVGYRGKEDQDRAVAEGKSKVNFPNGKHNKMPSMAIDVTPFLREKPVDLNDIPRHIYFGGYVMAVADMLYESGEISHKVRWGGDWDGDLNPEDGWDFVHFELMGA